MTDITTFLTRNARRLSTSPAPASVDCECNGCSPNLHADHEGCEAWCGACRTVVRAALRAGSESEVVDGDALMAGLAYELGLTDDVDALALELLVRVEAHRMVAA